MDSSQSPAPEALHPQAESAAEASEAANSKADTKPVKSRRGAYRPSHRATFIALIVVVVILAVNAGIIGFIISRGQAKANKQLQGQVVISPTVLSKLGVSQTPVGDQGLQLQVNPDAQFNGKVQIAGNVDISGQLKLNNTFTATGANFNQLQAGKVSLTDLDANGSGTFSTLTVRTEMDVAGITRLQGNVTVSNLLTVNNSANITGNLSVGGTLSINTLHISALVVDTSITVGGHIITRGSSPTVTAGGGALGSNGTVGISGNDQAGRISVNIGVGAVAGTLANITFHLPFSITPHVIITGVGKGMGSLYIASSSTDGFSVGTDSAIPPGGYAIDFIIAQ